MAANLSLSSVNVQTPTELHENVAITVRLNRVTLRQREQVIATADVTAVRRLERRRWLLVLDDGTEWAVQQIARSCCGQR